MHLKMDFSPITTYSLWVYKRFKSFLGLHRPIILHVSAYKLLWTKSLLAELHGQTHLLLILRLHGSTRCSALIRSSNWRPSARSLEASRPPPACRSRRTEGRLGDLSLWVFSGGWDAARLIPFRTSLWRHAERTPENVQLIRTDAVSADSHM